MAKGLDMLLALGKPPSSKGAGAMPGDEEEGEPAEPMDDAMVGAADDIRSALSAKDSEQLASALKAFVSMC